MCDKIWGAPTCGWLGACDEATGSCICEPDWEVMDFPVQGAMLCLRKDLAVRALHCTYAVLIWCNVVLHNLVAVLKFKFKSKAARRKLAWQLKCAVYMDLGFVFLLVCVTRGFFSAQGELFKSKISLSCFFLCAFFFNISHEVEVRNLIRIHTGTAQNIMLSADRLSAANKYTGNALAYVRFTHLVFLTSAIAVLLYPEKRALVVQYTCLLDFGVVLVFNHAFHKNILPLKSQLEELMALTKEKQEYKTFSQTGEHKRSVSPSTEKARNDFDAELVERVQYAINEMDANLAARKFFFVSRAVTALFALLPLTLALFPYLYIGFLVAASFKHFTSLIGELVLLSGRANLVKWTLQDQFSGRSNEVVPVVG